MFTKGLRIFFFNQINKYKLIFTELVHDPFTKCMLFKYTILDVVILAKNRFSLKKNPLNTNRTKDLQRNNNRNDNKKGVLTAEVAK